MDLRHRLTTMHIGALLACGVTALCTACGSSMPPPHDRLASSEAAARSAQELGAQNNPQSALYLQLANEENRQARRLMREGENERADRVLMRSRADAELSLMLAKEASAQSAANQAQELVRKAKSAPMQEPPAHQHPSPAQPPSK